MNVCLSAFAFPIFLALFLVESRSHLRAVFCIQNTLFLSHSKFVMLTEKSLVALARNTSSCFNKSSAFIQR